MSGLEWALNLLTAFYDLFMEDFVFRIPVCVVMGTFFFLLNALWTDTVKIISLVGKDLWPFYCVTVLPDKV
jgi:hypothetical protein